MSNSQPSQIYYDLDVVNTTSENTNASDTNQLNRLTFTEVRSSPILDNPSDYFLSIVRFSLDTAGSMPVVLPQINLDTSVGGLDYPNETTYFVTMKYNDGVNPVVYAKKRVIFIPQSFTQTGLNGTPQAPTGILDLVKVTQPYYWLSSFQFFINMINKALEDCYALLFAVINVLPYTPLPVDIPPPTGYAPYMLWNNDNNKATLVFPNLTPFSWKQSPLSSTPAKLELYFNNPLYTLFSSFETILNATYLDPAIVGLDGDEANWFIQNYDKYGTNTNVAGNVLYMEQPYSTGAIMSPIQSLVFNTSLIPILPQLIGVPRVLRGTTVNSTASGQNDNISNEITDLVVNLTRGDEYFPSVLYLPTAEYRLIDLNGNAPISAIQISVQWKDIYGIYHDFFLQNNCNCSMKIMFRKKSQGLD
jgi:hypothetical protein